MSNQREPDQGPTIYRHVFCIGCAESVGTIPERDETPAVKCVRCQDLDRRFGQLEAKLDRLLALLIPIEVRPPETE
jgi:hypothetical protein